MNYRIHNDASMGKPFSKASEAEKNFAIHEANKIIDYFLQHHNLSPDLKEYIGNGIAYGGANQKGGKTQSDEEPSDSWDGLFRGR